MTYTLVMFTIGTLGLLLLLAMLASFVEVLMRELVLLCPICHNYEATNTITGPGKPTLRYCSHHSPEEVTRAWDALVRRDSLALPNAFHST